MKKTFESSNADKMDMFTPESLYSVQNNNSGKCVVKNDEQNSNKIEFNVEKQFNSTYPRLNFTSSISMTELTNPIIPPNMKKLQERKQPQNIFEALDKGCEKSRYANSQNNNITSSFDSYDEINSTSTTCKYIKAANGTNSRQHPHSSVNSIDSNVSQVFAEQERSSKRIFHVKVNEMLLSSASIEYLHFY